MTIVLRAKYEFPWYILNREDLTLGQFFYRSKAGLNSEFSFSQTGCLNKAKESSLPSYLLSVGCVLVHINTCGLFNAKSCPYIHTYIHTNTHTHTHTHTVDSKNAHLNSFSFHYLWNHLIQLYFYTTVFKNLIWTLVRKCNWLVDSVVEICLVIY